MRDTPQPRMRGTVLLLGAGASMSAEIELMRLNGLLVYECGRLAEALAHIQQRPVDVVVARLPGEGSRSAVLALRDAADYATSIIVLADPDARDAAREAGADSFLPNSVQPSDLLYEIHRALILRRSGRRLPWSR